MLQFEELKLNLEAMRPEIDDLASALGLSQMKSEIQQLENRAAEPGFWDDMDNSQKILQRTANLKSKVEKYEKLDARYEDALALIEMGDEMGDGEDDGSPSSAGLVTIKLPPELVPAWRSYKRTNGTERIVEFIVDELKNTKAKEV